MPRPPHALPVRLATILLLPLLAGCLSSTPTDPAAQPPAGPARLGPAEPAASAGPVESQFHSRGGALPLTPTACAGSCVGVEGHEIPVEIDAPGRTVIGIGAVLDWTPLSPTTESLTLSLVYSYQSAQGPVRVALGSANGSNPLSLRLQGFAAPLVFTGELHLVITLPLRETGPVAWTTGVHESYRLDFVVTSRDVLPADVAALSPRPV